MMLVNAAAIGLALAKPINLKNHSAAAINRCISWSMSSCNNLLCIIDYLVSAEVKNILWM